MSSFKHIRAFQDTRLSGSVEGLFFKSPEEKAKALQMRKQKELDEEISSMQNVIDRAVDRNRSIFDPKSSLMQRHAATIKRLKGKKPVSTFDDGELSEAIMKNGLIADFSMLASSYAKIDQLIRMPSMFKGVQHNPDIRDAISYETWDDVNDKAIQSLTNAKAWVLDVGAVVPYFESPYRGDSPETSKGYNATNVLKLWDSGGGKIRKAMDVVIQQTVANMKEYQAILKTKAGLDDPDVKLSIYEAHCSRYGGLIVYQIGILHGLHRLARASIIACETVSKELYE